MALVHTQYRLCLVLHSLVVTVWLALVVVSITELDRKVTFRIDQLSLATAITPFITSVCVILAADLRVVMSSSLSSDSLITIIIGLPVRSFICLRLTF